jgi:polar amino acid transport system substrate-binding protein
MRGLLAFAVLMLGGGLATSPSARPLAEVRQAGELSVCSNPNALPYAADDPRTPGFQIEIARALAARLGVRLRVDWIVPRMRAGIVDCDILMDTILGSGLQPPSIRTSVPYHASGVALAFARGTPVVSGYKQLREGMKVGILTNSLASFVVSKTSATMVPFAFEDELVRGVARGDVTVGALSPAAVGYYNLKHPDQPLSLVLAEDEPDLRWNVAVGLRRADDPMIAAIDAALTALLADGTITGIYARYGIEHRRP